MGGMARVIPRSGLLTLLALFALWYGGSGVSNTATKHLLTLAPVPVLMTLLQFAVSTLGGYVAMWSGLGTYVAVAPEQDRLMWLLSAAYTGGFLCVNVGFVFIDVSQGETFRSGEVLVAALLSWLLMGQSLILPTIFSLVLVAGGIAVAAMSAPSFSITGFSLSMASNVLMAYRSVAAKAAQTSGAQRMDDVCLFTHVSARGSLMLTVTHAIVGVTLGYPQGAWETVEILSEQLPALLSNTVSFFLYNLASFLLLSYMDVVSHAVANAFRRVFTILVSVIWMGTVLRWMNWAGIVVAVSGVVMYSLTKPQPPPPVAEKV